MANSTTLDLAILKLGERMANLTSLIENGDAPDFSFIGEELADMSVRAKTLSDAAYTTDAAQGDV